MWQRARILREAGEEYAGKEIWVTGVPRPSKGESARFPGQIVVWERAVTTNIIHPRQTQRLIAIPIHILELLGGPDDFMDDEEVPAIPWEEFRK